MPKVASNEVELRDRIAAMSDEELTHMANLIQEQMVTRGLDMPPWDEPEGPEKRFSVQDVPQHGKTIESAPVAPQTLSVMAERPVSRDASDPVHIWVDGSYDKNTKAYSYGMVVEHEDGDDEFFAKKFSEDAASSMNNVAGELAGAKAALAYAQDNKLSHIVIHHDYTGIGEWADGRWKAKNPHTQSYQALVGSMRKQGLQVEFSHVSGHTGVAQNEKCDELAKHALGIELSKDYKVQQAGPYISQADKSAVVQNAISKAAQDFGFGDNQPQMF